MTLFENSVLAIESYLQADLCVDNNHDFKFFAKTLKQLSLEGEYEQVRRFAARAVTPYLDYSSLRSLHKYLKNENPKPESLRVAILGGPTILQFVELLEIFLASAGISAEIYQGDYGLFRQELMASNSSLDEFKPQIIFIATSSRDIVRRPFIANDESEVLSLLDAEVADWQRLWSLANKRWGATVIQNTFDCPPGDVLGHYSTRHPASFSNWVRRLNEEFAKSAPNFVVLHDLNQLVVERGAKEWFDPRFYLEAKMPCGPECLVSYAHSVMALLRGIVGKSKKVLVLDLDNTLWGGTIGDLGPGGIQLGQGSAEGEAFILFQQYAKSLQDRGILLAVCSKNDDLKAREPFEMRSDMILKLSDISCFVANWNDKAQNLRDIASNLSLGVDSLVFVDDNPAERALVRRLLPEVAVPEIPEDPSGYIEALAKHRYFETSSFTKEDAQRAKYYAQNAKREMLSSKAEDLDQFLASLEMKAVFDPVSSLNIERATQLINKSNQFNLTTTRYTQAEVFDLCKDPDWITLTISLKDSLGDNGLIAVLLLRKEGVRLHIESWLMSCRVLLRGVEHLTVNQIVKCAVSLGCQIIVGKYIPTSKNNMVCDLYPKLGFEQAEEVEGATIWHLAVQAFSPFHTHIKLENKND